MAARSIEEIRAERAAIVAEIGRHRCRSARLAASGGRRSG